MKKLNELNELLETLANDPIPFLEPDQVRSIRNLKGLTNKQKVEVLNTILNDNEQGDVESAVAVALTLGNRFPPKSHRAIAKIIGLWN